MTKQQSRPMTKQQKAEQQRKQAEFAKEALCQVDLSDATDAERRTIAAMYRKQFLKAERAIKS